MLLGRFLGRCCGIVCQPCGNQSTLFRHISSSETYNCLALTLLKVFKQGIAGKWFVMKQFLIKKTVLRQDVAGKLFTKYISRICLVSLLVIKQLCVLKEVFKQDTVGKSLASYAIMKQLY